MLAFIGEKIRNLKSKTTNQKVPSLSVRLGTFKQSVTFGFGFLMRRVPFGANADYLEIVLHKIFRLFIYAKISAFSQLNTNVERFEKQGGVKLFSAERCIIFVQFPTILTKFLQEK